MTVASRLGASSPSTVVSRRSVDRLRPAGDLVLSTLEERYGSLALTAWTPMFEVALMGRKALGLLPGEAELLMALLLSHRRANVWESIAQDRLARRLGIERTAVNRQMRALRRKGMVAVRPDENRRPSLLMNAPYHYCLAPYLAALAKHAARLERVLTTRQRLHDEADQRFRRFVAEVEAGSWEWRLGELTSASAAGMSAIADAFAGRYGLRPEAEVAG